MSSTSQQRALKNYRRRLNDRGMARFEVVGLKATFNCGWFTNTDKGLVVDVVVPVRLTKQ